MSKTKWEIWIEGAGITVEEYPSNFNRNDVINAANARWGGKVTGVNPAPTYAVDCKNPTRGGRASLSSSIAGNNLLLAFLSFGALIGLYFWEGPNEGTQISTTLEKPQITKNEINSSISSFPNTCFTSAHEDATDSNLAYVKCKVENTEPGVVIVKWSDGYTTKYTRYTDGTATIENISSNRKESNLSDSIRYGKSSETLSEHEGNSYMVVIADDGEESWISSDTFKNW